MRGNTGVLCSCCNLFPGCSKRDERAFSEVYRTDLHGCYLRNLSRCFYGILKQAYGLGAGNILSEEEKYAILKEMTLEFGRTSAGGRFPGGCGKGNQRGKRGRISWITIILPAARMRYSARFIMGIRRLCAREENWISMTCFFAAMNFLSREKISWRHGKTNSNTLW